MEYLFGRAGRRQAEARAQEQESARLAAEEELQRTRLEAELERQRMEAEMTRLTASMRDADAASLAGREADAVRIEQTAAGQREAQEEAEAAEAARRAAEVQMAELAGALQSQAEAADAAQKAAVEEAAAALAAANAEAARIRAEQEAEAASAERLAAQEAEAARLKAEEEAESARIAAEKLVAEEAEAARLKAEEEAARLAAEKLAAEEAEAARLKAEEEAEAARIAAEKLVTEEAEAARLKAEEEAEAARIAAEKLAAEEAEAARLKAEEEAEAARIAAEKLAAEEAEAAQLNAEEEAEAAAEVPHIQTRVADEQATEAARVPTKRRNQTANEPVVADVTICLPGSESALREMAESLPCFAESRRSLCDAYPPSQLLLEPSSVEELAARFERPWAVLLEWLRRPGELAAGATCELLELSDLAALAAELSANSSVGNEPKSPHSHVEMTRLDDGEVTLRAGHSGAVVETLAEGRVVRLKMNDDEKILTIPTTALVQWSDINMCSSFILAEVVTMLNESDKEFLLRRITGGQVAPFMTWPMTFGKFLSHNLTVLLFSERATEEKVADGRRSHSADPSVTQLMAKHLLQSIKKDGQSLRIDSPLFVALCSAGLERLAPELSQQQVTFMQLREELLQLPDAARNNLGKAVDHLRASLQGAAPQLTDADAETVATLATHMYGGGGIMTFAKTSAKNQFAAASQAIGDAASKQTVGVLQSKVRGVIEVLERVLCDERHQWADSAEAKDKLSEVMQQLQLARESTESISFRVAVVGPMKAGKSTAVCRRSVAYPRPFTPTSPNSPPIDSR
jgi:hypothetical protein